MKRIFLTGLFASLIAVACFAQKPYKVVFYNFENLFDTIHDPGVLDEEFTPKDPRSGTRPSTPGKSGTSNGCCSTSPPRIRIIPW